MHPNQTLKMYIAMYQFCLDYLWKSVFMTVVFQETSKLNKLFSKSVKNFRGLNSSITRKV